MRIFVSGGTGVIGRRVLRLLAEEGHEVTALARSDDRARLVESLGARPVRVDLFDGGALQAALAGHDVVVNLATSIPRGARVVSPAAWAENDRIRTEGSRALVDAALGAGVRRFVQESVTFLYAGGGSSPLDEDAPVEPTAVTASALDAERNAARFTAGGGAGVVLRFGMFYGPDSGHTRTMLQLARLGLDLLPGDEDAYASPIWLDDAAGAVVAALDAPPGVYNVVDDRPLTRAEFRQELAAAVGARRLRRPRPVRTAPAVLAHMARSSRVSNERFRRVTGWAPRVPDVRAGLARMMAAPGIERLPARARRTRILLGFLAAGALAVGAWAQFAPRSFHASFPGAGRAWVALDGPYNEHLVRDVGSLNLALAVVTLVAAASLTRTLVRTAAAAWLVYAVPHAVYHASHLAPLPPADRVANMVLLTAVVAAAVAAWRSESAMPSVPGRPATAPSTRSGRSTIQDEVRCFE